ncbi:MAG: hypothetical protein WA485_06730 [Candidatus Sulfotelmatobacter sp.]
MSLNSKKSIGWSVILILLGVIAIYAGAESLIVLIPVAILVWYGARPVLRGGRN